MDLCWSRGLLAISSVTGNTRLWDQKTDTNTDTRPRPRQRPEPQPSHVRPGRQVGSAEIDFRRPRTASHVQVSAGAGFILWTDTGKIVWVNHDKRSWHEEPKFTNRESIANKYSLS